MLGDQRLNRVPAAPYRAVARDRGRLFQERFHFFPIQDDGYLLAVIRYTERNPVRAGLVAQAKDYLSSSAQHHVRGGPGKAVIGARHQLKRSVGMMSVSVLSLLLVSGMYGCATGQKYFYANIDTLSTRENVAVLKIETGWFRNLRLDTLDEKTTPGNVTVIILPPGKHKLHFSTSAGSTQKYLIAEAGKTYLASARMNVPLGLNASNQVTIRDVTENPTYHDVELPRAAQ